MTHERESHMEQKELHNIMMGGVENWNQWRSENPQLLHQLSIAHINGANLMGANLSEANLNGAFLVDTNFSGANFSGSRMHDIRLNGSDLSGANLRMTLLGGAVLYWANLTGADFCGANLSGANLYKANLYGTNLSGADLDGANLFEVDLSKANLTGASLSGANLSKANLSGADLRGIDLSGANLTNANLYGTDLRGADLRNAILIQTNLKNSKLTNCRIYGISAWDVAFSKNTEQQNLIITPNHQPTITVDNLEVAQFIYLLLKNEKIRDIIDTITSKVVLILGRFVEERKSILNALREELRQRNFTPIMFDFEKPTSKDTTATVETLARMARFVIADLTDPSSIPHELATVIPTLRTTPILPLRLRSSDGYSMFDDFKKSYSWVLDVYEYKDARSLIASLSKVIAPADEMAENFRKKM